jgi:uncharacterized repeat protein (TIGR03803 family)
MGFMVWAGAIRAAQPVTTLSNLGYTEGGVPSKLVQASDGNFYGCCGAGGAYGTGSVFRLTPSGTLTVLYSFSAMDERTGYVNSDGAYPSTGLIQARDGNLYGTCGGGGAFDGGTVFRITLTGTLTTLHTFSAISLNGTNYVNADGIVPSGELIQARDGSLYGTCVRGGSNGSGTVFKITLGGTLTTLYSFSAADIVNDTLINADGVFPIGGIIQAKDGDLYGTCSQGGVNGTGTVFKLTTSGTLNTLYSFSALDYWATNSDGARPNASLVQAKDGNLYGTCPEGGTGGNGTVFQITTSGTMTTLHSFTSYYYELGNSDGANPEAGMMLASDGNLYGTCQAGGQNSIGTVFQVTTSGVLSTVYSFDGGPDGENPDTGLIQARDGGFYGTTLSDGPGDGGKVFKVTASGLFASIHDFEYSNVASPNGLVQASDGNFYGTSKFGGGYGDGTVFKVTPSGMVTILYSFSIRPDGLSNSDGANPSAALIQASDGNLYGTCSDGGAYGDGTIFRITMSGVFTTLYTFGPGGEGFGPTAGLIQARDGNLYGTALGTVFKITTSGVFTTLYTPPNNSEGGAPSSTLVQARDGNLYGTCYGGGVFNSGTIFKVTTSGAFTLLYTFTGGSDGAHPYAGLCQAKDGDLYGTCQFGAVYDQGTVFKISTSGEFTVLHLFNGGADGASPLSGLIQAADGNLYGTVTEAGGIGYGAVYKITPSGTFPTVHNFYYDDGSAPQATLALAHDGSLYGTTYTGGPNAYGTVFKLGRLARAFDANGDGRSDILLQNTNSDALTLWEMNGFDILKQGSLKQAPARSQQIVGAANFKGGSTTDLLIRDTSTGDVLLWTLNDWHVLTQSTIFKGLPLVWQVAGIGDFNGDGKADILWRNTQTGDTVIWLMDGAAVVGQTLVATVSLDWQVAGIGDFNGDGTDDVLWFNDLTGDVYLWEMQGSTIVNQGYVAVAVAEGWQVVGVGDLNGDGMDDVVWQNTLSGDVYAWEMNGITIQDQGYLAQGLAPVWQAAGMGDFNADGIEDLLWRNTRTGDIYLWEMNGPNIATEGYISQGFSLEWQIVAP